MPSAYRYLYKRNPNILPLNIGLLSLFSIINTFLLYYTGTLTIDNIILLSTVLLNKGDSEPQRKICGLESTDPKIFYKIIFNEILNNILTNL